MSIETEFESTITNVQNAYQGLDNLGATIPQNKTIENIKNCLDEIYNNLPKTSYAEGSNITLSNTLKGKLDFENDIVGIGDTSQKSYEGYNIYNPSLANMPTYYCIASLSNGEITLKATHDGEIYYGGVAGSGNGYSTSLGVKIPVKPSTTYRIGASNSVFSRFFITKFNSSDVSLGFEQANPTFTTDANTTYITLRGGVFNATNNVSYTAKIWVYDGSTDKDYEPYVGGTASPNPSYPQDIEVVRGKNIIDWANVNYIGKNGATITRTGSEYSVTSAGQFAFAEFSQEDLKLKPNTNYVFRAKIKSTETSNGSVIRVNPLMTVTGIEIYSNRTTSGNIAKIAFTTPSTIPSNAAVGLYPYEVSKTTVFTDIMICEGTDVNTSYLPYNTIEVVERGKNAFAFETNSTKTWYGLGITMNNSSVTINGTSTNTSSVYAYGFNLKPLKLIGTYKLSGYTRNDSYLQLYWKDKNGNIKYKEMKNNPTITFDEGDYLFQLFIFASSGTIMTFNNETFNLQLEEGTTATPYTPHQETTQQLSLGEYEFAKIGNYVDTIEYDVDEDKVYKNEIISKYRLTSISQTWETVSTNTSNKKRYRTMDYASLIIPPSANSNIGSILCEYYKPQVAGSTGSYGAYQGIAIDTSGYVFINDNNYLDNLSGWKTWLDSVECYIYCVLITPVKKEITGTLKDQIKALYNSHSFTGTTIIEIDGQLPLIIKVRALKGN